MQNVVQAAGLLIFTRSRPRSFLLLKHKNRWDLPKGHAEPGEELIETALRETHEETGIPSSEMTIDPSFQYQMQYSVSSKKWGDYLKSVTYFLAFVPKPCEIALTEHIGYSWLPWPTGRIQTQTIDPLLEAVKHHWEKT